MGFGLNTQITKAEPEEGWVTQQLLWKTSRVFLWLQAQYDLQVRGSTKQKAIENTDAEENSNVQERGGRRSTVLSTAQAIPVVEFSYGNYISPQNLEAYSSPTRKPKPCTSWHTAHVFTNLPFHLYSVWLSHGSSIKSVLLWWIFPPVLLNYCLQQASKNKRHMEYTQYFVAYFRASLSKMRVSQGVKCPVARSVKCPTPDFISRHGLRVEGWGPAVVALQAQQRVCLKLSLFLCLCPSPELTH